MSKRQQVFMVHQALDAVLSPVGHRSADGNGGIPALFERVSRGKARWLKRVMYETLATSTEKCFAYTVADHLNCVTLDCWPSQFRCAKLLGFRSVRTVQRAARGLERIEVLTIRSNGKSGHRYAPVFLPGDIDTPVQPGGQSSSAKPDIDVRESLLSIHIKQSASTHEIDAAKLVEHGRPAYDRRTRGAIELELAKLLGADGFEILQKLAALDDSIIERLCRACVEGALGERELVAARLAALQFG